MRGGKLGVIMALWGGGLGAAEAFTSPGEGIYQSDGSAEDTQAAIYFAPSGSVIEIPAGEFVWKKPVRTGGKALHVRGAGGGQILGRSETVCQIGLGLKEVRLSSRADVGVGEVIRIVYTPHGDRWMEGVVKEVRGADLLVEVNSFAGEGEYGLWCVVKEGGSRILNHLISGAALEIQPSRSGLIEVSGLHFVAGDGNTWATSHIAVQHALGGRGFRIHHCRFSTNGDIGRGIEVRTLGGLIDNCGFDQGFDAGSGNGMGNDDQAIGFKAEGAGSSWKTASTMGKADTEGKMNTYVEDCYFVGFWTQCLDFDDNSRTVVRHCVFDHSGCASHGADTSTSGNRHFELYNNEFCFREVGEDTFNVTWWLFLRGGTGVITGNVMPDLRSQSWGDKAELKFTVMNLRRRAGPYPCWRGGWPVPHQIGQGHDGQGLVSDPVYIWGNEGGGVEFPSLEGYDRNECGEDAPAVTDYLQEGRDFFVGVAKPGYEKFRYPHPLRKIRVP